MKRKITQKLLAALLACSMIPWASIPVSAAPANIALSGTATASSYESGTTFTADKTIDGDLTTRWATGRNTAANEWLNINFGTAKSVQQVNINFERADDAQNILSYKVEFLNGDDVVQTFSKNEKAKQLEKIQLDTAVNATDVKVTILSADGGISNWVNVGIREIQVYSEIDLSYTLEEVAELIQGNVVIGADKETFPIPEVPDGYTIKINGADFEQIISADGKIQHPLTDKTVKVSYEITDTETEESLVTDDYTYTIAGTKTQASSKNGKPSVIPEIQEWYSDSTESVSPASITKVVYDNKNLESVVDEFIADYADFTGITLRKEKNDKAQANAFNFSMSAPDELLGNEGYTMNILSDRINVASISVIGNMYGMQTILQMYKSDSTGYPLGQMRDYPRFSVRGFVFDVARKPVSMDMIQEVARTMRYYKMNDFQVHLSDNYIWLEDYGTYATEDEGFKAYDAFRLECGVTNDNNESPTAKDYAFSKEEFRTFIQSQRAVGVNIVPEIDLPAHSNSFTKVWPELKVSNKVSNGHSLIDHMDIARPEAVNKIKEIFDDYTKGSNIVFDSETTVHVGADEFLTNATAYRNYINTIVPYVKQTNTVRMWGGLSWIKDNPVTTINEDAIENVEINLWSKDWADGIEMYNMGYKLINTIDDYGYMVPNGGMGRGAYGDLLNVTYVYNSFEPNRVRTSSGYKYVPSGDDQALGAAFAIWNDNIDKRASGLTESDLYWRFFDAMPFYAEKTWAATGKEKGSASAVTALAEKMGTGPNTNPYYQEDAVDATYESYDFNIGDGLNDTSANDRDLLLPEDSTAKIAGQALTLAGGSSYVTTPIEKLGNGNVLSFDITLTTLAKPGDIIFEAASPYGTHNIRVMEDGRLGFTRELYSYYFDYELPVGKTVNIKITTEQQVTKLYVNGEYVSNATGSFIHNDMVKKSGITNATFALPLQRIGSKTQSIRAIIDNVSVNTNTDPYNKAGWTGTTNTETIINNNDAEGKLIYAFDGKANTIWHSNWQGAEDKLTGNNSFYAELNFGKAYKINQFSFTPRQGQSSGFVTKADLYIKETENGDWKLVAENATFASDNTKKTFYFDEQKVQYVKFVAKASSDGWVAISEFDINNASMPVCTVYVEAGEGGKVQGGKDVQKDESVTVTATPNEGYEFDGWYSNLGEKVSDKLSYSFNVTKNISLEARFTKNQVENPFTDVRDGIYYYYPIMWAVKNKIASGYSDGTFRPDEDCTRGQVVMFLWNAAGRPVVTVEKNPFSDVNERGSFYNAIMWAYKNNIASGYSDGTFRPLKTVKRAEYVAFQYRAAKEPAVKTTVNPFTDVTEEKYPNFYNAIMWANENKITFGKTPTTFQPEANTSRSNVVTFLYRANNLKK